VIAASGLHAGDTVTRADLDAAAEKVLDTGFFSTVNYRYDPRATGPAAGYVVTLQVTEQPATTPVELDIPGQDADKLWQLMKSADGLIDRRIPGTERATTYYKHVLEEALRKSNYTAEITLKQEADLRAGTTVIICRPAHLPRIAAIRFEGNSAIASGTLQAALAKVAMGEEYTERDFRRLLELNLRPLYEELGRLTVAFRSVSMASAGDHAVAISAAIDEGPVWRLGRVDLRGEALPVAAMRDAAQFAEGAPANWKQFVTSVTNMEKVLRRDGYIAVSSRPVRNFRDGAAVVDVTVDVNKGRQFLFGELHIEGLDSITQQRLAALWRLPAGAPMNEPYITEFLHTVLPSLAGKVKSLHSGMHVRTGSNIVDVTITFR
jgi:outer membrane protein assembly factor BamA